MNNILLSAFDRRDFEDRTALIFLGERITYGEIAAEGRRVASGLQSLGVRKGDLVALHFKNSPQYLAALFGCWWIGAVAVPIRRWQSAPMTISWCNHLAVTCLLVEESLMEKLAPHLEELTSCRAIVSTAVAPNVSPVQPWDTLVGNNGCHQRVPVDDRDPVLILHTSGSTARPKAIGQSLHSLDARVRAQLAHLPFQPEDVVCVFSDSSHGFGLQAMTIPTFAVGATVLLMPEFDPALILHQMAKHGATITGGAPSYLHDLLKAARHETALPAAKLRFAITASDKLPVTVRREWGEVFKTTPLLEAFGLSETGTCILSNRPDDIGLGTVGRPFPGVRIRIVGPDGCDVPDGTVGELWCTCDFLSGYWNDPDASRRAMVDGWFKTGDQAVRDQEGRYRIVGRTGFMIKRGGIFVSPFEVEAALAEHSAITDCMVTGVPSEKWGQEVEAFVVLKHRISVVDLRAHAAAMLGEPGRPVRFWSVAAIPKTSLGKVVRGDTREMRASAQLLTE
jgi:acyl-CoA synthetase (AMP-forming)/AMP-acid ligase II